MDDIQIINTPEMYWLESVTINRRQITNIIIKTITYQKHALHMYTRVIVDT